MSESHMHYYPDHGSALPDYLQEAAVQETYSMSFETTSNGHHRDVDASSNNSVPVDRASLISRSTSETKTESVITNREIHKTREIHHIGPDGKPIAYSPYGAAYMYNAYPNPAHETYDAYDPGRPPSPAGQTPSERDVYAHNFSPYSAASPAKKPGRNLVELYGETAGEPYSEYGYSTDSPNMHRAMPQAPPRDYQPGNYEDIDAALVPPGERYGTYGYSGEPSIPATSPPGYEYGTEGFLDNRPSFDEQPPRTPQGQSVFVHGYEEAASVCESHSRHPHLDYAPESEGGEIQYRFPDLHELIEFLNHSNAVVRANAAAYLGHLCFRDDNIKQKTRTLGAIPALIQLIGEDVPEVQRNALGALKNLSYGRQNNANKIAIKNAEGIPAFVRLLRKSDDSEIKELTTGILWNLSSCEELKKIIIDDGLAVLVNTVIIPLSGYDRSTSPLDPIKPNCELNFSTVFRNASGVLRNVSSAGEYARKKLRTAEGLIESLIYMVRAAVAKNMLDCKSIENCMCILRNLSYRCQEIEDPDYDKPSAYPSVQSKASAPIRGLFAVSDNLGCFGAKKKKEGSAEKRIPMTRNPIMSAEEVSGMALLWQPEVVQCYLALLAECSNPETLEAAAGSIQNLAACAAWSPSLEIRASVRKDKGLPILVELLKIDSDRVICAIANALRNLAVDARNKDLIGNYAIRDLVSKLPNSPNHDSRISDDTIAAILSTLNEVVSKETDFARSLLELGGVERLNKIRHGPYSPRVIKFASELLYNMYQHVELREAYRKAGFKESHFLHGPPKVRNSLSSPTGTSSTLNRPKTQGAIKYEDRTGTLTHGNELNSTAASIPYSRSEELPLSELSEPSQIHRPHMGVFPPGMTAPEPVYAQVNRDKKRSRQPEIPVQLHEPAGDSWV